MVTGLKKVLAGYMVVCPIGPRNSYMHWVLNAPNVVILDWISRVGGWDTNKPAP